MLYLCGYTGAPVRPNKQHGFLRKIPKFCVFTFAVDWWVPFRPRHVTQLVGSKCESTCMLAVAAEHVVLFLPMISTCTKVCLLSLQSGAKATKISVCFYQPSRTMHVPVFASNHWVTRRVLNT
jgi:hypothetical protein